MRRVPKISEAEWEVRKVLWARSPQTAAEIIARLDEPSWIRTSHDHSSPSCVVAAPADAAKRRLTGKANPYNLLPQGLIITDIPLEPTARKR